MTSAPNKRKPVARWRKARNPDSGGRWDTPMNRMIWQRDHGNDRELWRGDKQLATARPDGRWSVFVGAGSIGQETDQRAAMERARDIVRQLEADSP